MHRHHQSKPGDYRGWLHFDLPMNPWCWLFGHTPRARVLEFTTIAPIIITDCAVCALRYQGDKEDMVRTVRAGLDRAAREELDHARVANLERLGQKQFNADVSRREGWASRRVSLHHQTLWPSRESCRSGRAMRGFGFQLHLGNKGSETPIDAHVKAGPFASYVTVGGIGGRFAELVGRGHKRDLKLEVQSLDGAEWDLRWKLWYDDDGGHDAHHKCDSWRRPKLWPWSAGREKARQWMCLRDGHLALNPLTAFWGHRSYHYTDVGDVRHGLLHMGLFPGDDYVVDFQLREVRRHRDHGPRWARRPGPVRWSAEWRADGEGIPVRNHDWKGDGVIASSENLGDWTPDSDQDWLPLAVASLKLRIEQDRQRYGYRPPKVTTG